MNAERLLKWDRRFLDAAQFFAGWSKDPSTQVGAVIVRPDDLSICSTGFNGFPRNTSDDPAIYEDRDQKLARIVHAEINALTLKRESVAGYWLYTWPFAPCDRCAAQIVQNQIARVVSPMQTEVLERWSAAFEVARQLFTESGIETVEIAH